MNCIVYVRDTPNTPIYSQYNAIARHCRKHNYPIAGKVLDYDGKHLHDAVNKVIADSGITALIIYSKDDVFPKYDDYLFYKIYLEKLNKKLIVCN